MSFDTQLPPLPELASLASVKEFCSGLLESPTEHPWGEWFVREKRRKAMSVGHSLFLFRKTIPAVGTPSDQSRRYIDKMSVADTEADPSLLSFINEEIPRLFPPGWDRGYRLRAGGLLLPVKACLEAGRRRGGARIANTSLRYYRRVALGWERIDRPDVRARVESIRDGCKLRTVTVSSAEQAVLKPLHTLLYDQLARRDWLLRGDAVASRFGPFTRRAGEVFVSGDYEGATDNLSNQVYHALLSAIGCTSRQIPASIWELAHKRANSELFMPGDKTTTTQRRGQLMGTFLSFPFLCLANYMTFKWALPRPDIPVRINGDDIVFRATPEERDRWMARVKGAGLLLSRGKTLVDERFFTLNSTLFDASTHRVQLAGFVRARCLYERPATPAALAGQFASLTVSLSGARRRNWQRLFLSMHRRVIAQSQRSCTRGLGLRVPDSVLREAGLLRRERFYLGLESEEPLPAFGEPGVARTQAPTGFRSFTRKSAGLSRTEWREAKGLKGAFLLALRLHAEGPPTVPGGSKEYREVLQRGTVRYWRPKRAVWACFVRWRCARSEPEQLDLRTCEHRGGTRCLGCRSCHLNRPAPPRLVRPVPWASWKGNQRVGEERVVLPLEGSDGPGERAGLGWAQRPAREDWGA